MIRFYRENSLVGTVDFCEPQLNLLAHAQAIELPTGSRCGGHGVCGGDLIRIRKVIPPDHPDEEMLFSRITEKEKEHLTPDDLHAGIRLACQTFPNHPDLEVEVELLV